jgi:hypothetical protein
MSMTDASMCEDRQRGRTLTAVIEDAVRQFLSRTAAGESRPKASSFRVITFKGGLRPGVDLDDSARPFLGYARASWWACSVFMVTLGSSSLARQATPLKSRFHSECVRLSCGQVLRDNQ